MQTFGQAERNNNRSSQIESTQGGQLTDGNKTPRQSINQCSAYTSRRTF